METKIKVSTEITEALETVKPGDIVKSINNDGILLVVQTENNGTSFNGFVLDRGNYADWFEKDYGRGFMTSNFKPFIGTVTLESY
ncbi:hypothetical protein HNL35_34 [Bacteroides phage HNL35]|nr:hypothetical protein HNL05_34 [Bacteroides phage HNL05]QIG64616.1 hypothetical protein HNL35_34 [Bacteroides phage HNL35]